MIPAISLLRSQFHRCPRIPGRSFLFVAVGVMAICFLCKSGLMKATTEVDRLSLFSLVLLFALFALAVVINFGQVRGVRKSRPSEKGLLVWQDQFANDEHPLVLIADDDIFMRSALDFHLTRAGFRVEHATNGDEAVAKVNRHTALVLLDLAMPGTDGFYCLRDVRKASPTTKIVALTRKNHAQDAVLCRKLGAYHSLPKPLDPYDVVAAVARAVNNEPMRHTDFALSA